MPQVKLVPQMEQMPRAQPVPLEGPMLPVRSVPQVWVQPWVRV